MVTTRECLPRRVTIKSLSARLHRLAEVTREEIEKKDARIAELEQLVKDLQSDIEHLTGVDKLAHS